ncbi:hypothetical protein PSET11_01284 [Arthrobacter ulcerisalmonis]|uniref:PKD domain-containing protein n=1 Tax=Arthrobacter ulcerisalmonis TaxID=2483813 RepID=A0A3P5WRR3_9MICC|nr:hypothetical protein [Arthrobacter ulcerisalmonis]VDC23842.1 hypothetical protein PSET11_01284 [Arthrobacter ulcerisalmonis]
MKNLKRLLFSGGVVLLLMLVLSLVRASGDSGAGSSPPKGHWGAAGAEVVGWVLNPDTGQFVSAETSGAIASADPNEYKYELQCHLGGGDFDTRCLGYQLKCEDRPGGVVGIPVVWLSRPRGVPGAVWSNFSGPTCLYDAKPADVLPLIAAGIQREFESLPVSAGAVVAQPSPNTLRGAATNFYAEAGVQEFDVVMFGQQVHVVATPVLYTWNYGDGSVFGPQASMGGPLPQARWGEETRTSHVFGATGDFQVVMTTSFSGTYSVNSGPPLPIPGQGRFSAPPQTISVWRSLTRNYADDCLANPQGQGCPGAAPQR